MKMPPKLAVIASLLALALTLTLPATLQAQDRAQPQRGSDGLYRGWSAEEMLDTEVRGPRGEDIGKVEDIIVGADGIIRRVVVEAGGFLDIGDRHIGVPWEAARIGPEMDHVKVPVTEENRRGYPLYDGRDPAAGNWRVKELIGDLARLEDTPIYGRVHDVIFDESGKAKAVVVDRRMGRWGPAGPYAHPYTGYRPGSAYDLPQRSADVAGDSRFDYVRLGELSRFSGAAAGQTQPR